MTSHLLHEDDKSQTPVGYKLERTLYLELFNDLQLNVVAGISLNIDADTFRMAKQIGLPQVARFCAAAKSMV